VALVVFFNYGPEDMHKVSNEYTVVLKIDSDLLKFQTGLKLQANFVNQSVTIRRHRRLDEMSRIAPLFHISLFHYSLNTYVHVVLSSFNA
jgi:hypothetical protein